jgi:hypothetical protein
LETQPLRPPPDVPSTTTTPAGGSGPVHGDLVLTVVVDGRRRIVLDLSQLKVLGAAGLAVFCVTTGRLRTLGGRLRLTAVPARMRRIL